MKNFVDVCTRKCPNLNFLKDGLHLVVIAILAINLIAVLCNLKFFKVCRVSPE